MEIDLERQGDGALARISGRLDALSAPDLKAAIDGALEAGARQLALDLADVTFIDSTGLGALVGALKRARALGGTLRIDARSKAVDKLLRLTTLDRVFS